MKVLLSFLFVLAALSGNSLAFGFENLIVSPSVSDLGWSSSYEQPDNALITTFSLHNGPINPPWSVAASASVTPQGQLLVTTNHQTKALLIYEKKRLTIEPGNTSHLSYAPPDMMVVLAASQDARSIDSCFKQIAAARALRDSPCPRDIMSLVRSSGHFNQCGGLPLLATRTLPPSNGVAAVYNQLPNQPAGTGYNYRRDRFNLSRVWAMGEEAMEED